MEIADALMPEQMLSSVSKKPNFWKDWIRNTLILSKH